MAYPAVEITWEKTERVAPFQTPAGAVVLNREAVSDSPMVCLFPHGRGNCLLLAAELDPEGYARFPYFPQELQRAGIDFPFRSETLSAFFDSAYRIKQDPYVLAESWRKTGIQELHVGAWDFFDPDSTYEEYLRKLIDACHRNGILVYSWLELPHVSTDFWNEHAGWREKTATGRDAHVDWRFVMNLDDPQCYKAVIEGLEQLLRSFDWDGVNLSELYFESAAGPDNPDSFTPLNSFVRAAFKQQTGIDPAEYFRKGSPRYWKKNASDWKKFVDYRVNKERDMHERFLNLLGGFRSSFRPDLDIAVTYVDNIYDPSMREAVGADVDVIFKLLDRYDFTLILEDPGTVWHLGPRRYAELAETYSKMTPHAPQLGIDINIVERDIRAYPTEKQTGAEFLELFYNAGRHFQTVMVYAEQSIFEQDLGLVACALAPAAHAGIAGRGIRLNASRPFVYRSGLTQADFEVDGRSWPCVNSGDVSLPAGAHLLSAAGAEGTPRPHLIKLNGGLESARYIGNRTIEFAYNSRRRVISIFDRAPKTIQIDGGAAVATQNAWSMLPRGAHKITASF